MFQVILAFFMYNSGIKKADPALFLMWYVTRLSNGRAKNVGNVNKVILQTVLRVLVTLLNQSTVS